jgi:hypothetical protein
MTPAGGGTLQREALRVCDRYVTEVVLAFGLCPWAEAVLRDGTLARHVLEDGRAVPADVLPIIDQWTGGGAGAGDEVVEVGFVILPRYSGSRGAFDSFAEGVRRADRARRTSGAAVPFVIAAFHPQGADQFVGPHQLVSFLRRSPDPLLQLVRVDRLDRVKSLSPDVSNQIAERNHAAMTAGEAERFNAAIRAIRADRDEAYARLA